VRKKKDTVTLILTVACNRADYQITWKVFKMTVRVHLFTAADNQIFLSILSGKQHSFMMLCIIWYI